MQTDQLDESQLLPLWSSKSQTFEILLKVWSFALVVVFPLCVALHVLERLSKKWTDGWFINEALHVTLFIVECSLFFLFFHCHISCQECGLVCRLLLFSFALCWWTNTSKPEHQFKLILFVTYWCALLAAVKHDSLMGVSGNYVVKIQGGKLGVGLVSFSSTFAKLALIHSVYFPHTSLTSNTGQGNTK